MPNVRSDKQRYFDRKRRVRGFEKPFLFSKKTPYNRTDFKNFTEDENGQ